MHLAPQTSSRKECCRGRVMLRRALSGLVMYTVFGVLAAHAGQFLEAPQYPVGANPQAVAYGDFRHKDNSGNLDVVVANSGNPGGNSISVLLGNGDGTFQAQRFTQPTPPLRELPSGILMVTATQISP